MICEECDRELVYCSGIDVQPHGESSYYEGYKCPSCGPDEDDSDAVDTE